MGKYKNFTDAQLDTRNYRDPRAFDACYGAAKFFHTRCTGDNDAGYINNQFLELVNYGAKLLYVAHLLGFKVRDDGFIVNDRGTKFTLDDIIHILESRLNLREDYHGT